MSNDLKYNPSRVNTQSRSISYNPTTQNNSITLKEYTHNEITINKPSPSENNTFDLDSFLYKEYEPNKPTSSTHSNNSYSDKDNIYINKISDVMTDIQNQLGPKYYSIYSEYIKGLTLSSIIDKEGTLNIITDQNRLASILQKQGINKNPTEVMTYINNVLGTDKVNLSFITPDLLSSTITEVVSSNCGYDSIVLKNSADNYMIINSCTNNKSTNDVFVLAYVLAKQIVGDDELLELAIEKILPTLNNSTINNSEYYLDLINNGGVDYLEEVYNAQLNDNMNLIKKYIEISQTEGTKVELSGYSLGGGIQLTAYSTLMVQNPELEQYIQSVNVFNPFISFLEQNPSNTGENEEKTSFQDFTSFTSSNQNTLVKYIASSEKVNIYSGEEDYISTFNNCVYELLDRFTFVKTEDLQTNSVKDINGIYEIVLGKKANHGFKNIESDSFNNEGNITELGKYVPISQSFSNAITSEQSFIERLFKPFQEFIYREDNKNTYKVDYSSIIGNTLNIANLESLISGFPQAAPILKRVSRYFKNNAGDYTYKGITKAISEGVWDVIEGTIEKEIPKMVENAISSNLGWLDTIGAKEIVTDVVSDLAVSITNKYKDKEAFMDAFYGFLKSSDNKETVISLLSNLENGDYVRAYLKINELMGNFEESFEISYENVGVESINILGVEIEYTNIIEKEINKIIKNEILKIFDDIVSTEIDKAIESATQNIGVDDVTGFITDFLKGDK